MKHLLSIFRTLILVLLANSSTVYAENNAAIALPVNELHQSLLEAMKMEGADQFESRVVLLEPVVTKSFNFTYISRLVTGREWKKLDAAKQQDFISTFKTLTIATYANRFDGYENESFSTTSVKTLKNNRYLVRTKLETSDEAVSLDYIVQEDNSRWKIVNVIANGVSDLSLKRAEYATLITKSGFEKLMEEIRAQIAAQKQG